MIRRELQPRPEYIYPSEEWRMVEKRFQEKYLPQAESLFCVSNGYLGIRGSVEEGRPGFNPGTYVNGFYESWPIVYGEQAFGFARTGQTIVNLTDARIIRLYVDDEPFYLPTAGLAGYERALDMRNGTLDRDLIWETPAGKKVRIRSRRLVSFEHRHLAAISYEVTVLNATAPVVISSEMLAGHENHGAAEGTDPRRAHGLRGRVLLPRKRYGREQRFVMAHVTHRSGMSVACGVDHFFETECPFFVETACEENAAKAVYNVKARPGAPIRLTKYLTYHTSRSAPPEELCERAERTWRASAGSSTTSGAAPT